MGKSALGKGLFALIPETTKNGVSESVDVQSEERAGGEVNFLSPEDIKFNSVQPRKEYGLDQLDELVLSIKEKGILQPILVRMVNGEYEVVAGERRLRASKQLKLSKIPVVVKNINDEESLVIALVENIQREDLNPLEQAEAFSQLIKKHGYTQEAVAKSIGKNRTTVANILRLLNLPQNIQASLSRGELSMGHARCLLGVIDPIERNDVFKRCLEAKMSVRELEALVASLRDAEKTTKKILKAKDHDILNLEARLSESLGTKVECKTQKKKGKIIISYYSLDDLDRIIGILKK